MLDPRRVVLDHRGGALNDREMLLAGGDGLLAEVVFHEDMNRWYA
jgi:hypothetical protein